MDIVIDISVIFTQRSEAVNGNTINNSEPSSKHTSTNPTQPSSSSAKPLVNTCQLPHVNHQPLASTVQSSPGISLPSTSTSHTPAGTPQQLLDSSKLNTDISHSFSDSIQPPLIKIGSGKSFRTQANGLQITQLFSQSPSQCSDHKIQTRRPKRSLSNSSGSKGQLDKTIAVSEAQFRLAKMFDKSKPVVKNQVKPIIPVPAQAEPTVKVMLLTFSVERFIINIKLNYYVFSN